MKIEFARWTGLVVVTICCLVIAERGARANVINLSDQSLTDGDTDFSESLGETLTTTDDIFLRVDVTMTGNGGVLDSAAAFSLVGLGTNSAGVMSVGQPWQATEWGIFETAGCCNTNSSTAIDVNTTTLVMKVDYTISLISLWVNPNLAAVEGAADHTLAITKATASLTRVTYDIGTAHSNDVAYTNGAVYDDGDTPFNAVPEPTAMIMGLLSILGLATTRRRRK